MRTLHINRSFYGYNSGDDKALTSKETPIEHKSSLAKDAFEISKNTFKTASLQVAPMKALTGSDIQTAQKSTIGSIATQVFITSGKTSVPFLYPGCVVEMEMYDSINKEANYLTKLMITQVNHVNVKYVDHLNHIQKHLRLFLLKNQKILVRKKVIELELVIIDY